MPANAAVRAEMHEPMAKSSLYTFISTTVKNKQIFWFP